MNNLFKGQDLLEFAARFGTDLDCKKYLSDFKWEKGYKCRKCENSSFQERSNYSRTCNKCSHTESVTANTLFHKVKFGLRKAFFICFEMSTSTKSLSASYIAVRFTITEKTARLFMHKVREAMKSSGNNPMDGCVEVDKFVVGGKEESKVGRSYDIKKKKAVCAVEFPDDMKFKRMYISKIDNFSSAELKNMFVTHISPKAEVLQINGEGMVL